MLITGHTGFKGSWLALWLLEMGAKVSGLSLPPLHSPNLFDELRLSARLNHCTGNINDSKLVRDVVESCQPEIVFHLAAQPLVRRSYVDPVSLGIQTLLALSI